MDTTQAVATIIASLNDLTWDGPTKEDEHTYFAEDFNSKTARKAWTRDMAVNAVELEAPNAGDTETDQLVSEIITKLEAAGFDALLKTRHLEAAAYFDALEAA